MRYVDGSTLAHDRGLDMLTDVSQSLARSSMASEPFSAEWHQPFGVWVSSLRLMSGCDNRWSCVCASTSFNRQRRVFTDRLASALSL